MTDRLNSKALGYCLRLLKVRLRSEKELRDKLSQRHYNPGDIEKVVNYLKSLGEIDDKAFLKCWIDDRMNLNPKAPFAIRLELRKKGLDKELIDKALEELAAKHDFRQIALGLAQRRLQTFKKGLDEEKAKKRIFDYLRRRGFEISIIYEIIDEIF
jgi:regulatory protein